MCNLTFGTFSRFSVYPGLAPGCQPARFDRQRHVFDARRRRRRLLRRRGRPEGEENCFRRKRRRKDSGRLFEVTPVYRFTADFDYDQQATVPSSHLALSLQSPVTNRSLTSYQRVNRLFLTRYSSVARPLLICCSPFFPRLSVNSKGHVILN